MVYITMEQIQYNGYFEGVGFDPVRQVDYIPTLDRKNQRLNAADQAALEQVQRNNQIRIQNAENAGKDLEALSKLSGTLRDVVGKITKEREKKRKEEDFKAGMEAARNGEIDTTSYDQGRSDARDQHQQVVDITSEMAGDDEDAFEATNSIEQRTAHRSIEFAEGFARIRMAQYGLYMEENVRPENYKSRAEYRAALADASAKYANINGLDQASAAFLARNVYGPMIEYETRALSSWTKTNAQDESGLRQDEAKMLLAANKDVGSFFNSVRTTVGPNGKPLGYRGAWDLFDKYIVELRNAGELTSEDVKDMMKQPIPGDPKGRTYGELHGPKFKNIEKQVAKQEITDWKEDQNRKQMMFQQAEEALVNSFLDRAADPDGFTDEQIDDAIQTLYENYHIKSSKLEKLKQTSVDAETRRDQEKQIQNLIKMGLLTPERLSNFDPQLQRTHMSTAQQQAKLAADNNNFSTQLEAIQRMVEMEAKELPDGRHHITTGLKVSQMQNKFRNYLVQYSMLDPSNAAQQALNQTVADYKQEKAEVEASTGKPFFDAENGFPGMIGPATSAQEMERRVAAVNYAIQNKSLDTFGILTTDELTASVKGYGEPGWSPLPIVDYIAQELGVDPLTVLNKQLKAADMTELPPSPAVEVVQNQLSPEQQKLLYQFKTADRSTRGLMGQTQYNPEIVPKGYGAAVQDAASKHGIDPSILAGLIETESTWDPGAVSKVGARGLGQFMPDTAAEFGVNVNDPIASINGAAKYLKYLQDYFNGDMRLAIIAYNGGMGNVQKYGGAIPGNTENQEYYGKVIKAAGKYGYGKQALSEPAVIRASSPVLAYISGNIGPTSTGPHLDVKEVGGGRFAEDALDDYVEVDDPEFGRVSLGDIRKRTGGIGSNFDEHVARGSHGIDYGLYSGTKVFVKNGAKVIGSRPSAHGDVVTIQLPNGKQYTFLHGNKA